jgi:hypothetical protein
MRTTLLVAGFLLSAPALPLQAGTWQLDGTGGSVTASCDGRDVTISGSGLRIQLSGACGDVAVHGSEHQISLDQVRVLSISGHDNRVRATQVQALTVTSRGNRVSAALQAAETSRVAIDGAAQRLELTFLGPSQVAVQGTHHVLLWEGQEPAFSTAGADHRIELKP